MHSVNLQGRNTIENVAFALFICPEASSFIHLLGRYSDSHLLVYILHYNLAQTNLVKTILF